MQTDFNDEADLSVSSDDGLDDGYDSYDDIRPNSSRDSSHDLLKYTIEEEQQVVKRFDRKLVPFLALLYLLSFLDRSSTFQVAWTMRPLKYQPGKLLS